MYGGNVSGQILKSGTTLSRVVNYSNHTALMAVWALLVDKNQPMTLLHRRRLRMDVCQVPAIEAWMITPTTLCTVIRMIALSHSYVGYLTKVPTIMPQIL